MGAIVMLRRSPHGPSDPALQVLQLFPQWNGTRPWLYAVGFKDGRVKVGITLRPRNRMRQHWNQVDGQIAWMHLFGHISDERRPGGNAVEQAALRNCSAIAERIGRSECFRGLSKADTLRCCRAAINALPAERAKAA